MQSVTLPNSLLTISEGGFRDCANLLSVEIPSSVTEIEAYAFYNCKKLHSVFLEPTIKTIHTKAFTYTHPTRIYYNGSKEDWERVNKAEDSVPTESEIIYKENSY